MPWKRLIAELEEIVGSPGTDGLTLDSDRLAAIRDLLRRLGISGLRPRDIADSYLAVLPRGHRRGKGIYYTPNQVVEFILDQVIPHPRTNKKGHDPFPPGFTLLEPACGAGYFLLGALARFRDCYHRAGHKPGHALRTILGERLAAIDIDGDALLVAVTALLQEAGDDADLALRDGPLTLRFYRADFLDRSRDGSATPLGDILKGDVSAVVGNPPYVSFYAKRAESISTKARAYYKAHYRMGKGRINTYCLFIERAFDLLAPAGVLGFIVPNTLLIMKSYEPLRRYLLERGWLKCVVDLSLKVFPEVEVPTCVLAVERKDERALPFPRTLKAGLWESARGEAPIELESKDQAEFEKLPYAMFNVHIRSADREVLEAIERAGRPLGDFFEVRDGINPANMISKLVIRSFEHLDPPFRPVLRGKDIGPYQLTWDHLWVRYDPQFADMQKGEYCFLREERIFKERPKILTRQTADRIMAAWDQVGYYALNSVHVTIPINGGMDLKCLLAIYNSRVLNYYYRLVFPDTEPVYPQVKTVNVEKLPLPAVEGDRDRLQGLVDDMLGCLGDGPTGNERREELSENINRLVYRLYGLSPEHIAHIERSPYTSVRKSSRH